MRWTIPLPVAAVAGLLVGLVPARAANDPGATRQWNMGIVGAETAWATGTGGSATVAVIDTGVDLAHEDLAGRIVAGWNFVERNATAQDDHGHGTHVAGIVGAIANNRRGVIGVAPDVKLMPVRVLRATPNPDDPGASGSSADVSAGIRWAADHGAHVINLSLGEDLQGIPLFGPSFVNAIEYAWSRGAICVVAAGNDSLQSSGFDHETHAVVVTATTNADTQAAYASDVGRFVINDPLWGMAAPGGAGTDPPDGDDILSTFWLPTSPNAYGYAAGTSMAAPHVSGALAILRALGLSRDQAVERVTTTAKDLGRAGRDSVYGYGRLDVAKAVAGLTPAPTGGGGASSGGAGGTSGSSGGSGAAGGSRTGTAGRSTSTVAANGERGAPDMAIVDRPPTSKGGTGTATTDDVYGVTVEELGAPDGDGGVGGDGTPVWPLGLPAIALLALVARRAVRAGRRA